MSDQLVLYPKSIWSLHTSPMERYSSAWTPASFGGDLLAWYDANSGVFNDAGITPASNGDAVQQWNDLSANGYHITQATSQARPTYRSTVLNGNPSLQFVAASTQHLRTSSNAVALGTQEISAFYVTHMFATTQNDGRLSVFFASTLGSTNPSFNNRESAVLAARDFNRDAVRNTRVFNSFTVPISTSFPFRVGAIFDGAQQLAYQNSNPSETSPSTGTFGALGALGIGSDLQSSAATGSIASWDGYVSEAVLVKRALASSEIIQLDYYFKLRWPSS